MGIVSRELVRVRTQANGVVCAHEAHTDHDGEKHWFYGVHDVSEAALTTTMNARDLDGVMRRKGRRQVRQFVRAGLGDPDDFVHVDPFTARGKRFACVKRFAKKPYDDDPDFMDNIAPWIAGLTIPTIRNLFTPPLTVARANNIKDRATEMASLTGMSAAVAADNLLIEDEDGLDE